MQTSGSAAGASDNRTGFAMCVDSSSIVTKVAGISEARALPCGAIVGDLHGGLTFTDAVAAALEARSLSGWQEIQTAGKTWTIIVLNR
jgi:crotonobetainyl-CoA:carnitine CoA-transferase CaiB-like acyl-CoA transferase